MPSGPQRVAKLSFMSNDARAAIAAGVNGWLAISSVVTEFARGTLHTRKMPRFSRAASTTLSLRKIMAAVPKRGGESSQSDASRPSGRSTFVS